MPARLRRVLSVLKEYGISGKSRQKGSHCIFHRADGKGRPFPIPAGNGDKTEIDDAYLRALCRALEIDYAEFKKKL
jgi:predicted RNA binding protein YcfA (HicA-like mRNA interferase family)